MNGREPILVLRKKGQEKSEVMQYTDMGFELWKTRNHNMCQSICDTRLVSRPQGYELDEQENLVTGLFVPWSDEIAFHCSVFLIWVRSYVGERKK